MQPSSNTATSVPIAITRPTSSNTPDPYSFVGNPYQQQILPSPFQSRGPSPSQSVRLSHAQSMRASPVQSTKPSPSQSTIASPYQSRLPSPLTFFSSDFPEPPSCGALKPIPPLKQHLTR